MLDPVEKTPHEKDHPRVRESVSKKPYQQPQIEWEKRMEPIVHAVTCALEGGQGPLCDASPTA